MRTAILLAIAVTFSTVSAQAEAVRPRIVLAKLVSSAALEGERDAIAAEVRTSIETTGLFKVAKPDTVRTMVAVSPSAACPQTRCAIVLGRLVEADMVLTGDIIERAGIISVALRIYEVRDGEISHRLAFDVSTRREDLTRDVDAGVRSMLGLGVRSKSQSASNERIEMAAADRSPSIVSTHHTARTYNYDNILNQQVWRARFDALN